MYHCQECGRTFGEPVEVVEDPSEGGLRGCPHCGAIAIRDLELLAEMAEERDRLESESQ